MAFPGYGAVAAYILSWIDKLVPSKKAALYDELKILEVKYQEALNKGDDTGAAIIRKTMDELRKKAHFSNGDL